MRERNSHSDSAEGLNEIYGVLINFLQSNATLLPYVIIRFSVNYSSNTFNAHNVVKKIRFQEISRNACDMTLALKSIFYRSNQIYKQKILFYFIVYLY